jgi:hypothetical protein
MALRLTTGLVTELMGDGTGDALKALLADGIMDIYSGSQPATADADEGSGTKLVSITLDSGDFTGGAPTNGLEFDAAVAGVLSKAAAETWSGIGLAVGTARWFRFYDNAYTTGVSTTAVRFDGNVSTTSSQLVLSSTAIQVSLPIAVTTFKLTLPKS